MTDQSYLLKKVISALKISQKGTTIYINFRLELTPFSYVIFDHYINGIGIICDQIDPVSLQSESTWNSPSDEFTSYFLFIRDSLNRLISQIIYAFKY